MKLSTPYHTTHPARLQTIAGTYPPVADGASGRWDASKSAAAIRLPVSAPSLGRELYTDLSTAMDLAAQMRQLIAVHRTLYGEYPARLRQPN